MAILSEVCQSDNFELHNSLKPSFTIIQGLPLNFIGYKSFLESYSHGSIRDKLGWLSWFWQFLCKGLSSFNLKRLCYLYVWSCSLCEGRTTFCIGFVSRKSADSGFTSFSVLLIFTLAIAFFVFVYGFWYYFI